MKFIWKHKGTRIWFLTSCIVLGLALIISVVLTCVPLIDNTLDIVLGGPSANITEDLRDELYDREFDNKDDVLSAAQDFVIDVNEEGIILLKNENNALPFDENSLNVSVFGKNSVNLVYTGSGSATGTSNTVSYDLYDSLTSAGISYNPTLKDFYDNNSLSGSGRAASPNTSTGQRYAGWATGETPISSYTSDLESSYSEYNDAAIVVITRIGGEGYDLPRSMATDFSLTEPIEGASSPTDHYLELDANEKDLISYVEDRFDKVVVVLNVGTTMELGDLQNDSDIDAILWMGFPGGTGVMALGEILVGKTSEGEELSPSGKTVDIWARDFTQDPTWYNTSTYDLTYNINGNYQGYGNRYLYNGNTTSFAFVNYDEGIYMGYRYYETRAYEESLAGNDSFYEDSVVYPFGYGLSYTTFDVTAEFPIISSLDLNTTIEVELTVTNTGNYPGKEVVELYYTAPYIDGEIEKSYVELAAFDKTSTLEPGEEETLTLEINVEDMASYDYADANSNGFVGYELDEGDYTISLRSDSHTVIDEATYTLSENIQISSKTDARGNEASIENRFDDVSAGLFGDKTYSSYTTRSDFASTLPCSYPTEAERTLTEELYSEFNNSIKMRYTESDEGMPWEVIGESPSTTQVDNGISLYDMLYDENGEFVGSVDFDDERWDSLLDEISLDEMKSLIGSAAFSTIAVDGINGVVEKPATTDSDGPSGFTNFMSMTDSTIYNTCIYQGEIVIGSTWNVDLAYRMGQLIGEEGLVGNERGDGMPYSGWYAPAVNLHRSPFSGRNWEYYSEDPLLSGKFAAEVIKGASEKGVYCYIKHFAVNDQETDRELNGIFVWANEQSIRELYLKPFEIAVKEGGANAMMSSFNRIGTTWAGGSYALLTEILRDEWGFRGMVITDYSLNNYTYVDMMIRAGGDLFLTQFPKTFYKDDDATQVTLLRKATKNIMYVVANSNVMSVKVSGYSWPMWQAIMTYIDIGLVVASAIWGVSIILYTKNKEKAKVTTEEAEHI